MKRQNLLTIWVKRILPMFAMAGAGLMVGCDKPVDDPYAEPIDPVKVLKWGKFLGKDSVQYDNVMKYANDPRITTIIYFLDSTNNNDYIETNSNGISLLRDAWQERLDYTPKATGGGTFIFGRSKLSSENEAWFKANGWDVKTR